VSLRCDVDFARRAGISKSHTLTHMINLALHEVLGDGVSQKGSLVDDTKARFDFSHGKAMTPSECQRVEELVQEAVGRAMPVHIETVPLDKALAINNLRAVFGERYPDPVRVVSIGPTVPQLLAKPDSPEWEQYSIELCGGTHISETAVLDTFALVEESAVAKGVRRVVGVTGEIAAAALSAGAALQSRLNTLISMEVAKADTAAVDANRQALNQLRQDLDTATTSTHLKAQLREAMAAREKELNQRSKKLLAAETDSAAQDALAQAMEARDAGQKFVVLQLGEGVDGKAMQPLVRQVLKQSGIAVLAFSTAAGRVSCFAAVPDDLVDDLSANAWLKPVLEDVDGRGGGKAAQAQGSGTNVDGMARAVDTARSVACELLGK